LYFSKDAPNLSRLGHRDMVRWLLPRQYVVRMIVRSLPN